MTQTEPIAGKVIVITGASSGIGRATAIHLATLGAKVVLGARREVRLREICAEIEKTGGQSSWKVTDVVDAQSVHELIDHARKTFGPIDVLINNAGTNTLGDVKKLQLEAWNRMIDVNVKGALNGIAAVLPEMEERGSGHILATSSVCAHQLIPKMTVYCGTKFALRAIHEGLREEVGPGIRVTMVSPGAVTTEIGTDNDPEAMEFFMNDFKDLPFLEPEDIARAFAYAISQPDTVDVSEVTVRPKA